MMKVLAFQEQERYNEYSENIGIFRKGIAMKKLLTSLCLLALVLVCVFAEPSVAEATSFGYCGNSVSWVLDDDGTLAISGTGAMQSYSTYTLAPWDSLRNSIKNVVICDGVTEIGSYAFYYCENLESVTIADSITSIGNHAFYGCRSMTAVTIPDSTTHIGDWAFSDCEKLTGITIPDGITVIGEGAFFDCKSLRSVTIGNGVTAIEKQAFADCESLTEINIPDCVTTIGNSAFSSCSSLTSIVIGNSVTTIGGGAFNYCSSLTSITIPDSVVSIDAKFYDCKRLTTLRIAEGSEKITEAMVVCKSQLTKVYIPSSVSAVEETAFPGCSSLTGVYITDVAAWCKINFASYTANPIHYSRDLYLNGEQVIDLVIPDGVVRVGDYVFYDGDNLKTITIPDSVTTVGDYAFAACNRLNYTTYDNAKYLGNPTNPYLYLARATSETIESVSIHRDTKIIGYAAFQSCVNLTSVTIPDSVTNISNCAFYNCSRLTSVSIGDGVENIGKYAFYGCASLSAVTLGNNVTNICDYAFYNCDRLTSIVLTDNVEVIGKQAFYDCDGMATVTLGNNVTIIGDYVFSDCDRLAAIIIPDRVTTIGNYAFYNCAGLTDITLGDNVTTIGEHAFYACNSLNYTTYDNAKYLGSSSNPYFYLVKATSTSIPSAIIHSDARFVGEFAFEGCYNLKEVIIPDHVIVIGNRAFYSVGLASVTVGSSVMRIGQWSFYGTDITSIAIPDSVNVIGEGAFFSCNKLTDVYYAGDQTQWEAISIEGENNVLGEIEIWFNHAAEHTFTTYVSNDNATCTEDGTETAQCDYCDETYTRTVIGSAKGHSYTKKVIKPTCTAKGYTTYSCACGDTYDSDYTNALGHSYSNACDTSCNRANCGATRAITHSYTAATCTKAKTCKVCGAVSGKALGHSYKSGKCTRCNYKPAGAKITAQPVNVAVANGKAAKVTVKATGTGLKYTWYYAKKGAKTYSKATSTTNSYSLKMSSSYDGTKVYCVVSDSYGNSVKSNVVTLYKGTPAKITTQPKSVTVANGKTGKLELKASGTGLKYTWYIKYKGATSWTKVGSSSNTYSFKMASKLNGAQAYCAVTDKYGITVKSSVVTIKMPAQPKITTQPKSVTQVSGKTVKFTVKASGEGLKYQWYYAKKGSSSFKKVSGATKATYSVKVSPSVNGRKYYCLVTDKYGQTVKSSAVTLTMKTVAKITAQPKSVTVKNGKTAKVTIKAVGDGLKYTWYYLKPGTTKYVKASATGATFSVKMAAAWKNAKVYCVISDKYGTTVKSSVVTMKMK